VARKSSIDGLDPALRVELDAAIKRGATIDEITWMLKGLGADVSRSAVGRYSKQYADLAARQRDLQSIAKAFGSEFGEAGSHQGRLMNQLLTSIITRAVMPLAAGDEETKAPDFKDLHFLARAVKDANSAAKIDTDREAKIRDDAIKQERSRSAAAAVEGARAAGASPETCQRIRAAILGLDLQPQGAAS
jgi:hypothetical protein